MFYNIVTIQIFLVVADFIILRWFDQGFKNKVIIQRSVTQVSLTVLKKLSRKRAYLGFTVAVLQTFF